MHAFADFALIFTVAVTVGLLLARVGLPAVLAYVTAGALLGPPGLQWVEKGELLDFVAELGVVMLLFTVGLEFSLSEVRRSWRAVIIGGLLQVGGTVAVTAAVAMLAGKSAAVGVAWGFLVALSSTAVVLRLLDARGESMAAHGRLVIGILIFQDLCVVPMMLMMPILSGDQTDLWSITRVLVTAVVLVGATLGLSQRVVPRLLRQVARGRSREMFLLAVLAIAGVTAWITSLTGLSLALGAFLAGMVLADTEYSHQAMAEVLPLRAVMMCVFFVTVGMLVDLELLVAQPLLVAGILSLIVVAKLGVAWVAGLVLRFPVRVAGLAGAALAQVGEFSFVLVGHATENKLVTAEESRLFLTASVLSIALAPLAVSAFPKFVAGSRALASVERILDRAAQAPEEVDYNELSGHVVVAGLGVGGRMVIAACEKAGIETVIIELNPDTVAKERLNGRKVVFGDVTAPEVLEHARIKDAVAFCLVTSDLAGSHRAAEVARALAPDLHIVFRTRFARDEGFERGPNVRVLSEEAAGAAAVAGAVLKELGIREWPEIIDELVAASAQVAADEEISLDTVATAARVVAG